MFFTITSPDKVDAALAYEHDRRKENVKMRGGKSQYQNKLNRSSISFTFWEKHKVSIFGTVASLGVAAVICGFVGSHIHHIHCDNGRVGSGVFLGCGVLIGLELTDLIWYGADILLMAKKIAKKTHSEETHLEPGCTDLIPMTNLKENHQTH